jgi:hypothetical protein
VRLLDDFEVDDGRHRLTLLRRAVIGGWPPRGGGGNVSRDIA